jgi:hypothetical protein
MKCKSCGTEIADKAIVCYRCGTSTTEAVRQPVAAKPKRSPLLAFVAIIALLLAALYLGRAAQTAAEPNIYRTAAGVLALVAILFFIFRVVRRR